MFLIRDLVVELADGYGRLIRFCVSLFVLLMIVSLLAATLSGGFSLTPYSVTSSTDSGLSEMRKILESHGFETKIIVSDPEIVTSLRRNVVYTIIGPTMSYDTQSALTIMSLLLNGSSVLIADDFGKANSLLSEMCRMVSTKSLAKIFLGDLIRRGAVVRSVRIIFNTSAIILDAGSYWRNPAYVVVRNFNDYYGVLSAGVDSVLTEFPAAIVVDATVYFPYNRTTKRIVAPLPPELGFMVTTQFSWLETDVDSARRGRATPDPNEWGGVPFVVSFLLEFPSGGRLAIIGDPDIFTNRVLRIADKEGFDNRRFVLDIFSWLSAPTGTRTVVFDETRKAITPENCLFGLALAMKVVTSFTRYWIIAPLLPLLFIMFFAVYLPHRIEIRIKIFKPSTKKVGTSPYYGRYLWYMYRGGYREAFRVIVDNLRRTIKMRLGIPEESWDEILEIMKERRPDIASQIKRLEEIVEIWKMIVAGKKVKVRPEEYLEMFDFIRKLKNVL